MQSGVPGFRGTYIQPPKLRNCPTANQPTSLRTLLIKTEPIPRATNLVRISRTRHVAVPGRRGDRPGLELVAAVAFAAILDAKEGVADGGDAVGGARP